MTSRLSKLVAAAVLAGSLPAAALAHDGEHDRDRDARPVVVAPAPRYLAPAPREEWRVQLREHRRDGLWRERELASCRAELGALDAARADFHARNSWRPGRLRRYDRGYYEQRAELERRMSELQRFAWR